MKPIECCVLIPALAPDERLSAYVDELRKAGYGRILVINDGSDAKYDGIFSAIAALDGCTVLKHEVNRGKGAGLKTGYAWVMQHKEIRGIVTADADGQHTVPDTLKLTEQLTETDELLLGSRDFSLKQKQVPFKSRMGNRTTSCMFRLLYGKWLPDTQTGLRAFHSGLCGKMLEIGGERYEYEMNQLISCAGWGIPMRPIGIETVYLDDNKSSHFHPLRDAWRIYKLLFGSLPNYYREKAKRK